MADFQESFLAKNVAAFHELVGLCMDMKRIYIPEHPSLQIEALVALLSASRSALEEAKENKTRLAKALRLRDNSFHPIAALATKVLFELSEANASPKAIVEARNHARYIQSNCSQRSQKKAADKKNNSVYKNDRSAVAPNHAKIIDQFARLIQTVTIEPNYLPSHLDLKVIMLNLVLQELRSKHTAVVFAELSLNNARLSCTQLFYGHNGLIQTANEVIDYITNVTRSSGTIYKKVSALRFNQPSEKRMTFVSIK
ncbi:MAG: hypothetical protein ACK5RG_11930 [Cyclobacteriaceae bacterium]|jgi:hypothetical protein